MIERNFVFNPPRNVNHGTLPTWLAGIAQFLIVRRAAKRSITLRETPLWWQDDGLLNWVKENDCEAIGQAIGRPDMVATHVIAVGCAGVFVPMLGSRDELALDPRLVPQTKHQESPYPDRFSQAIRKEMKKVSGPWLTCIVTENFFSFSTSVARTKRFVETYPETPIAFIFVFDRQAQTAQMHQAGFSDGALIDSREFSCIRGSDFVAAHPSPRVCTQAVKSNMNHTTLS
jgi:hypothetical protein